LSSMSLPLAQDSGSMSQDASMQQDVQHLEDELQGHSPTAGSNKRRSRPTQENGDPDEKERKRQRRLLQNRQSAALSRQRKKEFLGNLERRSNEVEAENKILKQQLGINDQRFRELEQKYAILLKQNEDLKFLLKNSDKADELNRILAQTYTAYIQASGLAVERNVLLESKIPVDHSFVQHASPSQQMCTVPRGMPQHVQDPSEHDQQQAALAVEQMAHHHQQQAQQEQQVLLEGQLHAIQAHQEEGHALAAASGEPTFDVADEAVLQRSNGQNSASVKTKV